MFVQSFNEWLRAALKLNRMRCGSMIWREPRLLNPVFHGDIPRLYEYLRRLGLTAEEIGAIFDRNPECLLRKFESTRAALLAIKRTFNMRQVNLYLRIRH